MFEKIGFRAYRTKDTRWFYRWVSQVSPFFNWVYRVVLGLEVKETTTYNSIKAGWLIEAPQEISKRFLQGIYESDGSVSVNSREITCVTFPNAVLIKELLEEFGVKSQIAKDKYKKIRITSKENFKKAHGLLFVPEIKTKRYQLLEKLTNRHKIFKSNY